MFKNVVVGFILLFVSFACPIAMSAIISSFDADSSLTVSADFDIVGFETFFDDEFLVEFGAGTGAVSGSGDDFFDLSSGDETTMGAFADGVVTGSPGSVDGYYLSSGELFIENTGISTFTGTLTFDLELYASIFTDSIDEAALAFSALFVGSEHFDDAGDLIVDEDIIDEAIEFDSSFEGVGAFSDTIVDSTTSTFTLGVDESILFFFELDAAGFADTSRSVTVPEPSTLIIFALGIIGLASCQLKKRL